MLIIGCYKRMLLRAIISVIVFLLMLFALYIAYCNNNDLTFFILQVLFYAQFLYKLIALRNSNILITDSEIALKNFTIVKYKLTEIIKIKEIKLNMYQKFLLGRFGRVLFQIYKGKFYRMFFSSNNIPRSYLIFIENKKEISLFEKLFKIDNFE